ncbi:hypothetical protein [Spirosoma fluviale]|uniref:Uncharacterized protein n=1 Tax=Spirosoma fluviale TaxID=1597977 RepID=A0A286FCA1_9BACT|nr:hypothetical protein [Spirosoma fluviale]SOD80867.1 hypothetical protein SAMN06269250_1593 [Spirosoma fluviale]
MTHAFCFLASFATAIYGSNQIHDQHRSAGNYIFVGGLLLLCLIIVLDYIAERLLAERHQRRAIRNGRRTKFSHINSFRS